MKKFYNFLESIKSFDPTLVESIRKAHEVIFEGLATDEALDSADMVLEQNTEEKIGEDAPLVEPEPTPEETMDISEQDITADTMEMESPTPSDEISEEEVSIDGLDELVPE